VSSNQNYYQSLIYYYARALEKVFTILNGQQKGPLQKMKALFRQAETGEKLEACKQELSRIVELFKVCSKNCRSMHIQSCRSFQAQVSGSILSQIGQMKTDAKEQHEQLVTLLEADSDLTSSDGSSVGTNNECGHPQLTSVLCRRQETLQA
jgi:hypothetical protein